MVYRDDFYIYIYEYGFQGHVYGWDIFYGIIWFFAPSNLVCHSMSIIGIWKLCATDASNLQVHNIVSSNKVISKVSFPRGLDKTSTKIIVNL